MSNQITFVCPDATVRVSVDRFRLESRTFYSWESTIHSDKSSRIVHIVASTLAASQIDMDDVIQAYWLARDLDMTNVALMYRGEFMIRPTEESLRIMREEKAFGYSAAVRTFIRTLDSSKQTLISDMAREFQGMMSMIHEVHSKVSKPYGYSSKDHGEVITLLESMHGTRTVYTALVSLRLANSSFAERRMTPVPTTATPQSALAFARVPQTPTTETPHSPFAFARVPPVPTPETPHSSFAFSRMPPASTTAPPEIRSSAAAAASSSRKRASESVIEQEKRRFE